MRKTEILTSFVAGFGIGIAGSVLLAPSAGVKTRRRIWQLASSARDASRDRADSIGQPAGDVTEKGKPTWRNGQVEMSQTVNDFKDKTKQKIDDAADGIKKAAEQVIDKSQDVAHNTGKKMEEGGKRLQDV